MIQASTFAYLRISDVFRLNESIVVSFYSDAPADIKINGFSSYKKTICNEGLSSLLFFKVPSVSNYFISYEKKQYPINVNEYPNIKYKFTLSTMVKNEDEYIIPWIEFHKSIGFEHFYIYDNCEAYDSISWTSSATESNLLESLSKYINQGIVTIINWPVPKRVNGKLFGQSSQQTHSLYAFNGSNYIGYIDIDEYINLKKHTTIGALFDELKSQQIATDCICFRSRLFYNPHNKSEGARDFLNIESCGPILDEARKKSIVNPKSISTFAIHLPSCQHHKYILKKHESYLNHYFFLNKDYRGKESCDFVDKTISKHIINSEYFNRNTGL